MKFRNIDIEKLIQLMKKHRLSEIGLKKGRESVKIKRFVDDSSFNDLDEFEEQSKNDSVFSDKEPEITGGVKSESIPVKKPKSKKYYEIKAPLVGTFYQCPSPDAEPFVDVGDHVKIGDTLCVLEAMKSMNNIESDVNGVVKEICVENAQLVEYGQVLIRIEKKA